MSKLAYIYTFLILFSGNGFAQQPAQPYLGTCDPELTRGEYYKYECERNDGSIGWLSGTKIGSGKPIIDIGGRDTSNAYMLTRLTPRYPGYSCYYSEGNINSPSQACIKSHIEATKLPPEKEEADCINMRVWNRYEEFKYWTKDESGMYWLSPGRRPTYTKEGQPIGLAGSGDSVITETFRILCPLRFRSMNVPYPYGTAR